MQTGPERELDGADSEKLSEVVDLFHSASDGMRAGFGPTTCQLSMSFTWDEREHCGHQLFFEHC